MDERKNDEGSFQEPEVDMPEGDEPPPRGTRAMGILRWVILGATVLLAVLTWWSFARAEMKRTDATAQTQPKYHCPMHPQITSDVPGECPICHMQLEPIDSDRSAPAAPPSSPRAAAPSAPTSPSGAPIPGDAPAGTVPIQLALDRVQAIGVRTSVATTKATSGTLRVTATVEAPEQGFAEVHVRSAGFVERVSVAQTGVSVGRGQALLGLYSPDLYQAQTELLAAGRWSDGDGGSRAADAARQKLQLLGMSDGDIGRVIEKAEPMRVVPVYAPQGGVISKKNVVLGSYVTPETTLYEIQDLSRVFIIADVFQMDVDRLRVGTEGRFAPARRPDEVVTAKVDLIDPIVNAETRTTRVRMQVKNEGQRFAPGEYGTVEFSLPTRTAVVVPRDAVIDTGRSTYVFVVESEGRFSPRSVLLGGEIGDDLAVRAGIASGERVVSGATFLIDSESRLQASARATP